MQLTIDNKSIEPVSWDNVESAITNMDGKINRWTVLSIGADEMSPRIVASGGERGVLLDFVSNDEEIPSSCVMPSNVSDIVTVWDGGHYNQYLAKYVVPKSIAIQAFKYFFEYRDKDSRLHWEDNDF